MKRKLVHLLLSAGLLFAPVYVHAQESTAEPPAVPTEQPPVELPPVDDLTDEATFVETLLRTVADLTYIPSAAAGVVVFTSAFSFVLFKVFGISLSGGRRMLTALGVQIVVWIAYTLLTRAGFGNQFTQWYDTIVTIVQALLPFAGSVFAAHVGYESAKARGVPLLGFKPPAKA